MNQLQGREIKNVALLDLTGSTSTDLLDHVSRISHVACILVPEGLMGKLLSIPMDGVAATVPVPNGKRVKVMSGQIVLSGEALSNPDTDANEILVAAGQLVITSPVQQAVRQQIVAIGQVIAPAGSETGLGAALTRMSGQVMYYPYTPGAAVKARTGSVNMSGAELANPTGQPTDILVCVGQLIVTSPIETLGYEHIVTVGQVVAPRESQAVLTGRITSLGSGPMFYSASPRVFDGKETFSGAFFDLLDEPITLVLDGKFTFADDVTPEQLKVKVSEIVFDGKLIAPPTLVPMLQILARQRSGKIVTSDEVD
jgi:hypothetical protein